MLKSIRISLVLYLLQIAVSSTISQENHCKTVLVCRENGSMNCDRTQGTCPPCLYESDGAYTCFTKTNGSCPFSALLADCENDNQPENTSAPTTETPTELTTEEGTETNEPEANTSSKKSNSGGNPWVIAFFTFLSIISLVSLCVFLFLYIQRKRQERKAFEESNGYVDSVVFTKSVVSSRPTVPNVSQSYYDVESGLESSISIFELQDSNTASGSSFKSSITRDTSTSSKTFRLSRFSNKSKTERNEDSISIADDSILIRDSDLSSINSEFCIDNEKLSITTPKSSKSKKFLTIVEEPEENESTILTPSNVKKSKEQNYNEDENDENMSVLTPPRPKNNKKFFNEQKSKDEQNFESITTPPRSKKNKTFFKKYNKNKTKRYPSTKTMTSEIRDSDLSSLQSEFCLDKSDFESIVDSERISVDIDQLKENSTSDQEKSNNQNKHSSSAGKMSKHSIRSSEKSTSSSIYCADSESPNFSKFMSEAPSNSSFIKAMNDVSLSETNSVFEVETDYLGAYSKKIDHSIDESLAQEVHENIADDTDVLGAYKQSIQTTKTQGNQIKDQGLESIKETGSHEHYGGSIDRFSSLYQPSEVGQDMKTDSRLSINSDESEFENYRSTNSIVMEARDTNFSTSSSILGDEFEFDANFGKKTSKKPVKSIEI